MNKAQKSSKTPQAKKKPHKWSLHNDIHIDNYAWLRLSDEEKKEGEKNSNATRVLQYLKQENEYANALLKPQEKIKDKIYNELVSRIKKDDTSIPYVKNGYWYYVKYQGDNEHPIYCRRKGSKSNKEETLLDCNELAKGHEYFSLGGIYVSQDGNLLAYCTDTLSRRIYTCYFKDLTTGKLLNHTLENCDGSLAWSKDNTTIFYTLKNKTNLLPEKILKHNIHTPQSKDEIVYHEKDTSYYIGVYLSKSDDYIVIYNSATNSTQYHILNSNNPHCAFTPFSKREKNHEYIIEHHKERWIIKTNDKAKNFRVMTTPVDTTDKKYWQELISYDESIFIEDYEVFDSYLAIEKKINGQTQIEIKNLTEKTNHHIQFPEETYTAGIGYNVEFDSKKIRYSYSSMTTPTTVFEYDMETKKQEILKQHEVLGGHNPDNYITKRIYATGRDGTEIPVSLVYNKNTKLDGNAPLLQYGYGAYGITIEASFSSNRLSLLDRGFIFAIAHIRGGQMLGRDWYENGRQHSKLNTFYDFIDCSKALIQRKYTRSSKLFATGGSAGGLLMGAVLNMEPSLYKGVVSVVPFVDVINTMYDESIPLTTNEFEEWGNPKIESDYRYMLEYSPYENICELEYPNILVMTGYYDSQVQYWEPAKWVAKLREYNRSDNMLIFKTDLSSGHSGASGRFKSLEDTALQYAFLISLA